MERRTIPRCEGDDSVTEQIVWYGLLAVIVFFYVKKILVARSITHYTPAELQQSLQGSSNKVVLDVRTNRERTSGNIKGSLHIPLHELNRRADELEKYRDKEIICYCASGNRSLSAAAKLRKKGFTVANLRGGIAEWNFQNRH